jgi:paraquat-inducible protein B
MATSSLLRRKNDSRARSTIRNFRRTRKFWLAPIIVVMVLLGALIVFAQGSAVAPFIYTLF